MIRVMLIQNGDAIKKVWIILDTCSADSVTNNLDYVEDLKNCAKDKELTVLKKGGLLLFDNITLPLSVHMKENYLVTSLSLTCVNNIAEVRVDTDTLIETAKNLVPSDGTVFKFKECGSGFYYYDMARTDEKNSDKITLNSLL